MLASLDGKIDGAFFGAAEAAPASHMCIRDRYTCDSFRFFNLFPVYFGGKGTASMRKGIMSVICESPMSGIPLPESAVLFSIPLRPIS